MSATTGAGMASAIATPASVTTGAEIIMSAIATVPAAGIRIGSVTGASRIGAVKVRSAEESQGAGRRRPATGDSTVRAAVAARPQPAEAAAEGEEEDAASAEAAEAAEDAVAVAAVVEERGERK